MKTALITGASRGIGKAIALELKNNGFSVIGTATTADGVNKLMEDDIKGYVLDLNSPKSVEDFWNKFEDNGEIISVLVNNAGIISDNIVLRMSDDQW